MIRQTAFALLGVVALACAGWTAAFAQDKPTGYTRPPVNGPSNRPLAVGQGLDTPSRGLRPERKQCFWRDAQAGGPFGASGTCPAASSAAVGSRCGCYSKGRVHQGAIIAMPPVQMGPSQVVR
jgi:hypothetical protein